VPESPATPTSLYRLTHDANLSLVACCQEKYIDKNGSYKFTTKETSVAGRAALLVYGAVPNPEPDWINHARGLTGETLEAANSTSAGLLFLRLHDESNYVYALSWGMGHQVIRPSSFDYAFGLRFALRRADSEPLVRGLTRHALDTTARTNRTSVFGGAALSVFGLEEAGEVISRLIGRISTEGLEAHDGGNRASITIRGADGLNISLAKSAAGLLRDLKFIDTVVEQHPPVPRLAHLEDTQPLRPSDGRIEALDAQLDQALEPGPHKLALCWPSEWDDEQGLVEAYRFSGWRTLKGDRDDFALDEILIALKTLLPEVRHQKLKSLRIQGLDRAKQACSREVAFEKWLTFETTFDGTQFVFHRGRWYNIGSAFLEMLRARLVRVFARESSVALPPWELRLNEKGEWRPKPEREYNEKVAQAGTGYTLLDRQCLYTQQHPGGIESCDLLGPNDELIHVKRLDDSVAASHLFNQALISFEALQSQQDAREALRERIEQNSGGRRTIDASDFRPRRIVLAFAGREASVASLFTFSQVSLYRLVDRLGLFDVDLRITSIDYSETAS
jgi:uncharacterized protein (TIGR04141 family)